MWLAIINKSDQKNELVAIDAAAYCIQFAWSLSTCQIVFIKAFLSRALNKITFPQFTWKSQVYFSYSHLFYIKWDTCPCVLQRLKITIWSISPGWPCNFTCSVRMWEPRREGYELEASLDSWHLSQWQKYRERNTLQTDGLFMCLICTRCVFSSCRWSVMHLLDGY